MLPSTLHRSVAPILWRILPAAAFVTLNPSPSIALVGANFFLHHRSQHDDNKHHNCCPPYYRSYSRSNAFSLSQSPSSSSSDTFSKPFGSAAVRSLKPPLPTNATQLQLLSFYRFIPITEPEIVRDTLFDRLKTIEGLRGTVYISKEGLNAQFAVPVGKPFDNLVLAFGKQEDDGEESFASNLLQVFGQGEHKDNYEGCLPFDTFEKSMPNIGDVVDIDTPTFERLIVRTRDFILRDHITDGESTLDWSDAGIELDASEWDEQLRSQPNIQLLDCRNSYESDQGAFVSAKPLQTETFSETWSVLDAQVESHAINPNEPVYIYCTGGIRCVKVGAYLKQRLGVSDVRSLKNGIIGYDRWKKNSENETSQGNTNLWVGENFLFDKRRFAKEDSDTKKER